MSSDAGDFFGELEGGPARDHRGRPLLVPAGMPSSVRVPYTRASSFADRVDDMRHIHRWEKRYLARAMAAEANQDLRELALAEVYTTSFDKPDDEINKASGRRLDDIIRRALDRQGIHIKADRGTAVHGFCESRDRLWEAPAEIKPYVEGYWEAIDREGIEILAVENFIANDILSVAGTFDSLVRHPVYGCCIADIKTGKLSTGFAVQEVGYAYGELYDYRDDSRKPLESLTGGEEVNRKVGLIFDVKPDGTEVYTVDLVRAWEVAKAILVVENELKMDIMSLMPRSTITDQIARADSEQEILAVWERTKDKWTDGHKAHAKRRRAEIGGTGAP